MELQAGEIMQNCAQTNGNDTSQTAVAEEIKGEKESSLLKRFGSANDLLNAYNSLEAEFTRRCQKIKELERENENLKSREQSYKDSREKDFQKGVAFKEKYPETQEILKSLYEIAAESGDDADGFLERAYVNYLKGEIENNKNYYTSDGYFLEKAGNVPAVRDKIIREYLIGVDGSKPNVRQFKGNGESLISPPSTPKTLKEATQLAKIIFEKSKEIK